MMWIERNEYYKRCIQLAMQSKAEQERYGALLVRKRVLGQGYNRTPRKSDTINMGLVNHAETNAINDALLQGNDVVGASLYVAGYFADIHILNIRIAPIFTCIKCPPRLEKYRLAALHVPTYDGWAAIAMSDLLQNAQMFHATTPGRNNYEKRLVVGNSGIPLEEIDF